MVKTIKKVQRVIDYLEQKVPYTSENEAMIELLKDVEAQELDSVNQISNPVTVTDKSGVKVADFVDKSRMVQAMLHCPDWRIRIEDNLYKVVDHLGTLKRVQK